MLNLEKLYEEYIESKKDSWSPITMKTERSRLRGITLEHLQQPSALHTHLAQVRNLKPYPLKTAFIRAGEFVDFLMERKKLPLGINPVKQFMRDKANLFKQVYKKKEVDLTFDEAKKRIAKLQDEEVKEKALQLLYTGMRYAESMAVNDDGQVKGKGGWVRDVPNAKEFEAKFSMSHTTFWRALKEIGLTPHDLRRLFATEMADKGAMEADLMKAMGWRSSNMASLYVQARREKELAGKFKQDLKEMRANADKQIPDTVPKVKRRATPSKRK